MAIVNLLPIDSILLEMKLSGVAEQKYAMLYEVSEKPVIFSSQPCFCAESEA